MDKNTLIRCKYCYNEIPELAQYCPVCRAILRKPYERVRVINSTEYQQVKNAEAYCNQAPYSGKLYCGNKNCGKEVSIDDKICPYCKTNFADNQAIDIQNIREAARKKQKTAVKNENKRSCFSYIAIVFLTAILVIFFGRNPSGYQILEKWNIYTYGLIIGLLK